MRKVRRGESEQILDADFEGPCTPSGTFLMRDCPRRADPAIVLERPDLSTEKVSQPGKSPEAAITLLVRERVIVSLRQVLAAYSCLQV